MVAALYVSEKGPYMSMPGVDAWPLSRDATRYDGPWPVVAHPPRGPWGNYAHKCLMSGHTGPTAVQQVRDWGGLLEHPKGSKLWRACGLPLPGEARDGFGGYTREVRQGWFGHRAPKATWLYVVGVDLSTLAWPAWAPSPPGRVERLSKREREETPLAFARWLVNAAENVRR